MDFFNSFSLAKMLPTGMAGDITFLLIFIVLAASLGVYIGRSRLVSMILYSFVGVALLLTLANTGVMAFVSPYAKVFMFLGIFLFLFLVGDYVLGFHISQSGSDVFWRTLVLSFLSLGMLTSIVFTLLPKSFLAQYVSPSTYSYFISPFSQIVWMILPLFFLMLTGRRA
jgi:hypothetical protein